MSEFTARLQRLHRQRNTANGNPQWLLILSPSSQGFTPDYAAKGDEVTGYAYHTAPDSVISHAITPELVGRLLTITTNDKSHVVDIGIVERGESIWPMFPSQNEPRAT